MKPKTEADARKLMLTELVKSLCHMPDNLEIDFHEQESTVLVQITAHPNDARILVGTARCHLTAIETLARLLYFGSHKLVQFMPIESWEDEPMLPQRKFVALDNWPETKFKSLLERLTKSCFHEASVMIESRQLNNFTHKFTVRLNPAQHPSAVSKFAAAIAILFVPIGAASGRYIHADVAKTF